MHYSIIVEEEYSPDYSGHRIVRNIKTGNMKRLLHVLFDEIDMVGADKLHILFLNPAEKETEGLWAISADEYGRQI